MKKALSLFLLLALLICLLPAQAAGPAGTLKVQFYSEADKRYPAAVETDLVRLTLNGAPLSAQDGVPALVQYVNGQGRTLVPVRLVAEALGAEVLWVGETRQVILMRSPDTIVLTLGSAKAAVNGQVVDLPGGVPAGAVKQMVGGKEVESTMVPLRFVSEQLGAKVDWDNDTFTAAIAASASTPSPAPSPSPTPSPAPSEGPILPPEAENPGQPVPTPSPSPTPNEPAKEDRGQVLRLESDANAQSIFIATDHVPDVRVTDLGNRVAVDVVGAKLGFSGTDGAFAAENECITRVRFSLHGDDLGYGYQHTVRVVLDLKSNVTYSRNIKVEQQVGGVLITAALEDDQHGGVDFIPSTPIDPNKLTVVLDAGHGGSAWGATYEDVKEKDLTLPMTKKLQAILLEKGYNVVLTREEDVYMDLYDRADIANAVEADIFVSIHCNASATNADFQGVFTYYHPSSNRGKRLAQAIQDPVCDATGAINRGIANNDYVVLRETDMAAVLVETGFMSCHEELMRLVDGSYQDKIVKGIAEGIVRYLNSVQN